MTALHKHYPPIASAAGAPDGAQYLVLQLHPDLTAERRLAVGAWINRTDGGAGGNYTYRFQPTGSHAFLTDDFVFGSNATSNRVGDLGWTIGAGTLAYVAPIADHPGVVQLSTGTTSGIIARLSNTNAAIATGDVDSIQGILRPTTSIADSKIRFGLVASTATAGEGSEGIYFSFSPADSANWRTITRITSTTVNTSSVAVTLNNWYYLELRRNGSNWEFYINNALAFTHTTNIPTGAEQMVFIVENTAAADKTLDVDWFQMRSKAFGQRYT